MIVFWGRGFGSANQVFITANQGDCSGLFSGRLWQFVSDKLVMDACVITNDRIMTATNCLSSTMIIGALLCFEGCWGLRILMQRQGSGVEQDMSSMH